jgi:hypothetical protein
MDDSESDMEEQEPNCVRSHARTRSESKISVSGFPFFDSIPSDMFNRLLVQIGMDLQQ